MLVDQLRASSSRVVELVSKLDDGHVATMIPTRIVDAARCRSINRCRSPPSSERRRRLHLPSHRDQLASLATAR